MAFFLLFFCGFYKRAKRVLSYFFLYLSSSSFFSYRCVSLCRLRFFRSLAHKRRGPPVRAVAVSQCFLGSVLADPRSNLSSAAQRRKKNTNFISPMRTCGQKSVLGRNEIGIGGSLLSLSHREMNSARLVCQNC